MRIVGSVVQSVAQPPGLPVNENASCGYSLGTMDVYGFFPNLKHIGDQVDFTVTLEGDGLQKFENMLAMLGSKQSHAVQRRAINRTGDMAKTQVIRALTKQTGLSRKIIVRAIKVNRAHERLLEYRMTATGGDISLKYFKARETKPGVTASLSGGRQLFEHSFMKGGRFPNRVTATGLGGHVYVRDGSRGNLKRLKSGVYIPKEIVLAATKQAFERTVREVLPRRLRHELNRASGGLFS